MEYEDFLEFLDFVDELDFHNENFARARVIRPRPNWFQDYDEADFFKRYRMSKETVLWILDQIDDNLEYSSDRNCSVPPIQQLMIALRFYATGSYQIVIGDLHGVHNSTVSRIIKRVTAAIVGLRNQFIKMPSTPRQIQQKQNEFYTIANFTYVIGTIDCTHVKIQSPGGEDAELFRNRKGYFSINCQTISDAHLKVQNVVARWPGSTHDSAIFTNSGVCREFESGRYGQACLLGDNGYPLKNYLLTPFLNPQTPAQENYNRSQIKTRNTVERQYGVIKRRFPALAMGLRINLHTACNVIVACCVLHNICVDFGEEMPPVPDDINAQVLDNLILEGQLQPNNPINNLIGNAIDRRNLLAQNFVHII